MARPVMQQRYLGNCTQKIVRVSVFTGPMFEKSRIRKIYQKKSQLGSKGAKYSAEAVALLLDFSLNGQAVSAKSLVGVQNDLSF